MGPERGGRPSTQMEKTKSVYSVSGHLEKFKGLLWCLENSKFILDMSLPSVQWTSSDWMGAMGTYSPVLLGSTPEKANVCFSSI